MPRQRKTPTPAPKVVELDTHGHDYRPVLKRFSENPRGCAQGWSRWAAEVGGSPNEEVLNVLEGKGEMIFSDGHSLPVQASHAVYYPPHRVHDVKNTG